MTGARTRAWLAALALTTTALVGCSPRASHPGTDLVIVLIDTLRPDHLGFYGHERETAPFLARLAADGVVFERAFSTSSWTAPATASLFTGLYPTGHGVVEGFHAHQRRMQEVAELGETEVPVNRLPADVPLLTERLRDAGYATFGVGTNINIGSDLGFDRGFDQFVYARKASARKVLRRIEPWREEILRSTAPTFLYLHLDDVHAPYKRHEPWYRAAGDELGDSRSAYDSEISYLDLALEEFSRDLGWEEDTLVVLVSDHGEEFMEHGRTGHGRGLHQELNRVLLSIRGPGIAPARIELNVSLIDLLPTLLDLLALEPAAETDGVSLAPLLRGEDAEALRARIEERTLFAHRRRQLEDGRNEWWSALRGRWKLIEDDGGRALYDHRDDFYERRDLADEQPERAAALAAALAEFRARGVRDDAGDRTTLRLDAETVEALRALGYVEEAEAPPEP